MKNKELTLREWGERILGKSVYTKMIREDQKKYLEYLMAYAEFVQGLGMEKDSKDKKG